MSPLVFSEVITEQLERLAAIGLPLLISGPAGSGKDSAVGYIKEKLQLKNIIKTDELINQDKYRTWFFSPESNTFSKDSILYFDRLELYEPEIQRLITEIIEYGEVFHENKKITIAAKVILSTNLSISELSNNASISESLLHHIQPFTIALPPLTARKDEIPLLISGFLTRFNQEIGKNIHISREALRFLTEYPFPGNTRELENLMKVFVSLKKNNETIAVEDMPVWLYDTINNTDLQGFLPGLTLKEYEKRIIQKTLGLTGGNRLKAAEMLGISERNLYRKIKEYEN